MPRFRLFKAKKTAPTPRFLTLKFYYEIAATKPKFANSNENFKHFDKRAKVDARS